MDMSQEYVITSNHNARSIPLIIPAKLKQAQQPRQISMSFRNIIGPRVKKARHQCDPPVTQEQLAIKLQIHGWDIDRFGVSRIERGVRQVTDKELLLLSTALGVTVSWLVGETQ